jgi:hypothetical protein
MLNATVTTTVAFGISGCFSDSNGRLRVVPCPYCVFQLRFGLLHRPDLEKCVRRCRVLIQSGQNNGTYDLIKEES